MRKMRGFGDGAEVEISPGAKWRCYRNLEMMILQIDCECSAVLYYCVCCVRFDCCLCAGAVASLQKKRRLRVGKADANHFQHCCRKPADSGAGKDENQCTADRDR